MIVSWWIRVVLLYSLLTVAVGLDAQLISGIVTDSLGHPLVGAQVVIQTATGSISTFTTAGDGGYFQIDVKSVAVGDSLIVRFLGFAPYVHNLSSFLRDEQRLVALVATTSEIREVMVSAEALPRVEKKDTIVFHTDAYRDGSERKVEELIAKLPGVEVDEQGKITIEGTALDRILLDGEDIFDRNYRLLSQNVPARLVTKIEVIKNYQEDRLIGDISGQRELVLDLTLDPDQKRPWFGEGSAQLGNADTRAANLSLFKLKKKIKTVAFADYNSLGDESSAGVDLLIRSQGLAGRQPEALKPVLESPARHLNRTLDPLDYLFNNTGGLAQTVIYQINGYTKNRLVYNISSQEHDFTDRWLREDLIPQRIDSFRQQNNYGYYNRRFWLQNDFDVALSRKSRLDLRLAVVGSLDRARWSSEDYLFRPDSVVNLQSDLNESALSCAFSSRYVRRLSETMALRLKATYRMERLDQTQDYRGNVYLNLIDAPSGQSVLQLFDQADRTFDVQADVLHKFADMQLSYTAGRINRYARIRTALGEEVQGEIYPAATTDYSFSESFARTSALREWDKVTLAGDLSLVYFRLPESRSGKSGKQSAAFSPQGQVNITFKLGRRAKLMLFANANQYTQQPADLVTDPYLLDNITLYAGLDRAFLERSYSTGGSYTYNNAFAQYGYAMRGSLTFVPNTVQTNIVTNRFVLFNQLTAGARRSSQNFSVSGYRYISSLRSNVKLLWKYDRYVTPLDLGGETDQTILSSNILDLYWSGRLGKKIRYTISGRYDAFTTQVGEMHVTQHQFSTTKSLRIELTKSFRFTAAYRLYLSQSGRGNGSVYLLEPTIEYTRKKIDMRIELGVRNLLEQTNMVEREVTAYQRLTYDYELRPRTVYLQCTKGF